MRIDIVGWNAYRTGYFRSDDFQAFGLRVSRNWIGSPASTRAFASSGEILFEGIIQAPSDAFLKDWGHFEGHLTQG